MSREIDKLIAEHVFKLVKSKKYKNGYWKILENGDKLWRSENGIPHYSTDISDAWEVVEKMNIDFALNYRNIGDGRMFKGMFFGGVHCVGAETDTAPMAICLASLKALNIKLPEGEE